jgi:hypothetical protein
MDNSITTFLIALMAYFAGIATETLRSYFGDMLTDRRRDCEAKAREAERFQNAVSQMPDLISEMKKDLYNPELRPIREFFVAKKAWTINFGEEPRFIYYEEDHAGLRGKAKVLDNFGYVIEVRPGTLPIYRMTEDFVKLIKTI